MWLVKIFLTSKVQIDVKYTCLDEKFHWCFQGFKLGKFVTL